MGRISAVRNGEQPSEAERKIRRYRSRGRKEEETLILELIDLYWKPLRSDNGRWHEVPTSKPLRDWGFRVRVLSDGQRKEQERIMSISRPRSQPRGKDGKVQSEWEVGKGDRSKDGKGGKRE